MSRFLSVGILGAVLDNVVLFSVVELSHISPVVAKAISAECSIVFMFLVNEFWTFATHGSKSLFGLLRRLLTSNVVRLGGLAVGFAVLYVFHHHLGVWYLLANVLGIGVGFIVNYVSESIFTWQLS